jgi:hypothetical protein
LRLDLVLRQGPGHVFLHQIAWVILALFKGLYYGNGVRCIAESDSDIP